MAHLSTLTNFAETAGQKSDLFGALGIDWKLLILQAIAFVILFVLLGKYAFPALVASIDKRQDQLDAGAKASEAAQKQAQDAESRIAEQLREARAQADAVVATAHKEASDMVAAAEARAAVKAEHIVAEAKAGIASDITAARAALKLETKQLVAEATEKIIGEKLTTASDNALIEKSLSTTRSKATV